jgi:hypothetical protein
VLDEVVASRRSPVPRHSRIATKAYRFLCLFDLMTLNWMFVGDAINNRHATRERCIPTIPWLFGLEKELHGIENGDSLRRPRYANPRCG